jgi:hypothetical protein
MSKNNPKQNLLRLTSGTINEKLARAMLAWPGTVLRGDVYDNRKLNEKVVYLPEYLKQLFHEAGYCVIQYCKGFGGRIYNYSSLTKEEKNNIDQRLRSSGLQQHLNNGTESASEENCKNFLVAAARLLQMSCDSGRHFVLYIEYLEHIAPNDPNGQQDQECVEILHSLANSIALRKSGNLLLTIVTKDGEESCLLASDLHTVEYGYPDENELQEFVDFILSRQARDVQLEHGFDSRQLAQLCGGVQNKHVERWLREAGNAGRPLTRKFVLAEKTKAVLETSEGSLKIPPPSSINSWDDMVGHAVAKQFFKMLAQKFAIASNALPRAVCICGPFGCGKTSFAELLAKEAQVNLVEFGQLQNMYLGESQRIASKAFKLIEENLMPCIVKIDEANLSLPQSNGPHNNGEVANDFLSKLFEFSSRESLRGRVLLLFMTNYPLSQLDATLKSRMLLVPFLDLQAEELTQLFPILARRIRQNSTLKNDDPALSEAGRLLCQKGASPRAAFDVINKAILCCHKDALTSAEVLAAARDYRNANDPRENEVCSLEALAMCSYNSLLPWWGQQEYEFPPYLDSLVDDKTGLLDQVAILQRIDRLHKELGR